MSSLALIRYADDFVIIHEDLNVIKICQGIIEEWLTNIGLELNQEKTKISHTLNEHKGQKPGFNFLGFNSTIGMNNWRFSCIKGDINYVLPMHSEIKIVRHTKVKDDSSPYDDNPMYWASRMGKHPEVKSSIARLLKKQKGSRKVKSLMG